MPTTVIRPHDPVVEADGQVSWTASLLHGSDEPATFTHRFTCPDPHELVASARPAVLGLLLAAMWLGDPVEVHGPLDDATVDHLREWQEVAAAWHPGVLHVVPLRAAERLEPRPQRRGGERRAITAFSGGVDSCFSAFRARPDDAPQIRAGVMTHGFDIAPGDHRFDGAFARSQRMLASEGLDAFRLATDVRSLERRFPVDWETASHAIWLASTLACFETWFDVSVVPSTFDYPGMILPWASSPVTDHLFGAGDRPLHHDGASQTKFTKVGQFAHLDAIRADIRVCWEGDEPDRNCGVCNKCISTQACFAIWGFDDLPAFDHRASLEETAGVAVKTGYQARIYREVRDGAADRGCHELAAALTTALERNGW